MTAKVGSITGHDHHVAHGHVDLLLTAWAKVPLAGLGGQYPPHLYVRVVTLRRQLGHLFELVQPGRKPG